MIMHFSKLVLKKEIIIIEMNQLFCNRVKALKYAVEDVLLLCNGDISKWSNSFARCVKIRNYRIDSFKRELLCGSKSKLYHFKTIIWEEKKCLEKLMFFIYCWLYICIICYILAAKNKKEGVVYD